MTAAARSGSGVPKKSGPAPESADVIELKGNRGHLSKEQIAERRAQEIKPRPLRASTPPADLSLYARECWDLHAPELDALGLVTLLDRGSLRLACETYAVARSALDDLKPRKADGTVDRRKKSLVVTVKDENHGGIKRHPALIVLAQFGGEYRRWCAEFGLTPSARISIRPAAGARPSGEVSRDDDDDDSAFFGT